MTMIKRKHTQLYDLLCREFRNGRWPKGEKLPTLKELAAEYSVSVNIVSKAVELLRENGFVSVKVGDGIYSCNEGAPPVVEFRHSGERVFGVYEMGKHLSVLVEDSLDWQVAFWNEFFAAFVRENPDVELAVNCNVQSPGQPARYDIAFGSSSFLAGSGFVPARLLSCDYLKRFGMGKSENLAITEQDLFWNGQAHYLPYGFIDYSLIASAGTPGAAAGENVLDYIERLAAKSKKPVGYCLHHGRGLLANCGISFVDAAGGCVVMPEREALLRVFRRARALYVAGHLVWPHGQVANFSEIYTMERTSNIHIAECAFNRDGISGNKNLRYLDYPRGGFRPIVPLTAAIDADSLFPEEALRLYHALLAPEIQKTAEAEHVFRAIDQCELPPQTAFLSWPDPDIRLILNYFVGWEFFYYLSGKRGDEVVDLLAHKIEHFLTRRSL